MKKIKVTFFNPNNLKKRVFKYIFTWDYNNHCWNVFVSSIFGEFQKIYTGDPMLFVTNVAKNKSSDEYVTIKNFQ